MPKKAIDSFLCRKELETRKHQKKHKANRKKTWSLFITHFVWFKLISPFKSRTKWIFAYNRMVNEKIPPTTEMMIMWFTFGQAYYQEAADNVQFRKYYWIFDYIQWYYPPTVIPKSNEKMFKFHRNEYMFQWIFCSIKTEWNHNRIKIIKSFNAL